MLGLFFFKQFFNISDHLGDGAFVCSFVLSPYVTSAIYEYKAVGVYEVAFDIYGAGII